MTATAVVDVAFPVRHAPEAALPADHGYVLYSALCRALPALEHGRRDDIAVHPVAGRLTGNRRIALTGDSRITLRVGAGQLADLITLTGTSLSVQGTTLHLGPPTVAPLKASPAVYSRLVTIHDAGATQDAGTFRRAAQHQLERLGVNGRVSLIDRRSATPFEGGAGNTAGVVRRTLRVADSEIVGYPVRVDGLSPADSIRLQASGIGGRRHFGAGVFLPEHSVAATAQVTQAPDPVPVAPAAPAAEVLRWLPELLPYAKRYAEVQHGGGVPLRVVMQLRPGGRITSYDALNLDNLLGWAVAFEAADGGRLPFDPAAAYALPVPLRALWHSPEGAPLWAATPFRPTGDAVEDVLYWHKRQQSGRWTHTDRGGFTIGSGSGRYMERRTPVPVTVCDSWVAEAIGDPTEIARLLEMVQFAGRRRSVGTAEIAAWTVTTADGFPLVTDGRLTRNLPAAAVSVLEGGQPEGEPVLVGWTPPQWKPALFAPGWWAGTPVVWSGGQ